MCVLVALIDLMEGQGLVSFATFLFANAVFKTVVVKHSMYFLRTNLFQLTCLDLHLGIPSLLK